MKKTETRGREKYRRKGEGREREREKKEGKEEKNEERKKRGERRKEVKEKRKKGEEKKGRGEKREGEKGKRERELEKVIARDGYCNLKAFRCFRILPRTRRFISTHRVLLPSHFSISWGYLPGGINNRRGSARGV